MKERGVRMDRLGGDPEGRQIARRRSQHLAEAGRVARALEVLLEEAGFETTACRALAASIAEQERHELLRGGGRIEPRKRFKGGGIQEPDPESERHYLFLDESGKSGPNSTSPFFALAGIGLTDGEAQMYKADANQVKREFFGNQRITFHEPEMRHGDGPFRFGGDRGKQQEFLAAIDALVERTDFVAFAVGIRKNAFEQQFAKTGLDPYLPMDIYAVAIQMLLERYVDYRATSSTKRTTSQVVFESQGPLEDAVHQRDYVGVLIDGTQWISASAFRQWLRTGVRFTPKQGSDPIEIADMLSRDTFEWIRDGCVSSPGRWGVFGKKFYCREDGRFGKFGLKVFPDSDIRAEIESHRAACGAEQTKSASTDEG
jgi:hypothetical protein